MNNLAKHWGGHSLCCPPTKLFGGGHVLPPSPWFRLNAGVDPGPDDYFSTPFHITQIRSYHSTDVAITLLSDNAAASLGGV